MNTETYRRPLARIVAISLVLWQAFGPVRATEPSKPLAIKQGAVWLDTSGKPINAHGGGILFHQGVYYWYGENKEGRSWMPECNKSWDGYRVDVTGIRCYSSKDLVIAINNNIGTYWR